MYAQSYLDPAHLAIPDSYGGTAFTKDESARDMPDRDEEYEKNDESENASCAPAHRPQLLNDAKRWFSDIGFHMPTIGIEEILIIAVGAFLIFSDERDITTAILLLALLFID